MLIVMLLAGINVCKSQSYEPEENEGISIPAGYKVKVYGKYEKGSGGNGNMPICNYDPNYACVIVKAETSTSYWNPGAIVRATIEVPDRNPGYEISISAISKVAVPGGGFEILYTQGTTWTGPFNIPSSDYTVTPIP